MANTIWRRSLSVKVRTDYKTYQNLHFLIDVQQILCLCSKFNVCQFELVSWTV